MASNRNLTGCQRFQSADLPHNWLCVPLGERIALEYGAGLTEEVRKPGPFPVYGSNGVVGSHNVALVKGPGLLVGRKGSVGAVHRTQADFWPIDTVYFVKRLADDHWSYLQVLLEYLDLAKLNAATGVPGLSRRDAYALRGAFPPPPEQAAIARILDAADTAIERTRAALDSARRVESGVLHALLTCGIDVRRGIRNREERPSEFTALRWGWYPAAWEASSVAEEFHLATGFTLGEHRRPQLNRRRYLRVANVQRGHITLVDVAELEAKDREMVDRTLALDDLLIVEGHADPYQIGRCARVPAEAVGLTFQNHLYRLRCRRLDPRFAELWMNSEQSRRYWQRMCSTSSGLNTINQRKLKSMPVLVPPRDEQENIADIAHRHRAHVAALEAALLRMERLRRGLMQDLLTGRVRTCAVNATASVSDNLLPSGALNGPAARHAPGVVVR